MARGGAVYKEICLSCAALPGSGVPSAPCRGWVLCPAELLEMLKRWKNCFSFWFLYIFNGHDLQLLGLT